jgi:hypothetical protein
MDSCSIELILKHAEVLGAYEGGRSMRGALPLWRRASKGSVTGRTF